MTRRVLLISYYFPPLGGAGVQRAVKFARYLPDFGWEPVVLTGPGTAGDRWAPLDASLADDARAVEVVHTSGGPRAEREGNSLLNALSSLGGRTAFSRWWPTAVVSASNRAPAVDLVVATMSPFQSARAAAEVARRRNIPWVADLRDPWALDEMFVYPSGAHRRWAERQMRLDLESASAIVMNTPEARTRLMRRFPEFANRTVVVIPNGYDANDFSAAPPETRDGSFRIVHTGSLHTGSGHELRRRGLVRRLAGGTPPGLDMLTRSHVVLTRALEALRSSAPELARDVQLYLAGVTSDEDLAVGNDMVHFLGYLPHAESIALLRSADLLFLPMHDLPIGTRATIIPGKTFEYLAAGRPILAAVPDGDARDLLEVAGNAYLVRPSDADGMERALRLAIESKHRATTAAQVPADLLAQHERRNLTGQLAAVLDDVVASTTARTRRSPMIDAPLGDRSVTR